MQLSLMCPSRIGKPADLRNSDLPLPNVFSGPRFPTRTKQLLLDVKLLLKLL